MALPGVRTTILDRFYNLQRTDLPGGPLIAVVAKRSTVQTTAAPDFTPYYSIGEQDVIAQFGDGSQLHRAYYELSTGGAPGIVLVPLPSDTVFNHNTAVLTSASSVGLDPFVEAMSAVETARADIVVLWGRGSYANDWDDFATPVATPGGSTTDYFYADNSTAFATSWVKKLADACADITLNSQPIVGMIGVKPLAGLEVPTPSQISSGVAFSSLIGRDALGATKDTGHFVSVIATELHPLNYPDAWGWSNGVCTYAALASRLNAWTATTGKPVYNVDRVRYNVTRPQADTLGQKGIVVAQLDQARSPRWVDGTTFSKSSSDFARLTTMRIVFDAVKIIRQISQNYIGEGMSISMRNAFETQISSSLRTMMQLGALNSADFRVLYSPSTNQAMVDLAVVPAFELREIDVKVSVNF